MIRLNKKYLLLALAILIIEIIIALYVKDSFIRSYGGDFLVVMLVYYGVKGVIKASNKAIAIFTLLFAYFVEACQHFDLITTLGLENNTAARIILGTSFSWEDMVIYTFGVGTVLVLEKWVDR